MSPVPLSPSELAAAAPGRSARAPFAALAVCVVVTPGALRGVAASVAIPDRPAVVAAVGLLALLGWAAARAVPVRVVVTDGVTDGAGAPPSASAARLLPSLVALPPLFGIALLAGPIGGPAAPLVRAWALAGAGALALVEGGVMWRHLRRVRRALPEPPPCPCDVR